MTLDELTPKPAGKEEVKFTLIIDNDGKVLIEKMSLDDGKKKVVRLDAMWLIEED